MTTESGSDFETGKAIKCMNCKNYDAESVYNQIHMMNALSAEAMPSKTKNGKLA